MGGDSRLIWNISKINYLMLSSLASECKWAPIIVNVLCIWTLTVWRGCGLNTFPDCLGHLFTPTQWWFCEFSQIGRYLGNAEYNNYNPGVFQIMGCRSLMLVKKLVKIVKSCHTCEIWSKLWKLGKIAKSGQNCEIWSKLWNLVNIVNSGQYCELWSILWTLVNIVKSGQYCEIWSILWKLVNIRNLVDIVISSWFGEIW